MLSSFHALLESETVEWIGRPMDFGTIRSEFVHYTESPACMINFLSFQFIKPRRSWELDRESSWMDLAHFLIPSVGLIWTVLGGLLLYSITWLLIKRFRRSATLGTRQVSILVVFYLLFAWMIAVLFSNSLNTASLIVDISDLLYNNDQILRTKKESCFMEASSEMDYYVNVSSVLVRFSSELLKKEKRKSELFKFPFKLWMRSSFRPRIKRSPTRSTRRGTARTSALWWLKISWATSSSAIQPKSSWSFRIWEWIYPFV